MRKIYAYIFLLVFFSAESQSLSEAYKNGIVAEKNGEYEKALEFYVETLKYAPSDQIKEQIALKMARISVLPTDKIEHYINFIKKYPTSRFSYLARYELGMLYYMIEEYNTALGVFKELTAVSFGTPYYVKSLLVTSALYMDLGNTAEALHAIYRVLEVVEDYAETAEAYFLAGRIYAGENKVTEAIEYLLICAGNFPDSYFGRLSLLELVKIYVNAKDTANAAIYAGVLAIKYPESSEFKEAENLAGKVAKKAAKSASEDLIEFQLDEDKKTTILDAIRSDITQTVNLTELSQGDKYFFKPGIYLQLGSYSQEKNAWEQVERLELKGTGKLRVYRGIGKDSYVYKVVSGPFENRKTANNEVIRLKDTGIDSFILEISQNYE